MKNSITLIIAIGCILVTSCTKRNEAAPSKQQNNALSPSHIPQNNSFSQEQDPGGDDDGPIVMEVTSDQGGNSVTNASVRWVNGNDTVTGITDNAGECVSRLTKTGQWTVNISHNGYACVNSSMNVVDSFAVHRDTLAQGQCRP